MRHCLIVVIPALCALSTARAALAQVQVIRVNVGTPCQSGCTGESWTLAIESLEDALTRTDTVLDCTAASPCQIWVAAETYTPGKKLCTQDTDCDGAGGGTCTVGQCVWVSPREQTFQLKNHVSIYGGFAVGDTSLDDQDLILNETTLGGDLGNDDVPVACVPNSPLCDSYGSMSHCQLEV